MLFPSYRESQPVPMRLLDRLFGHGKEMMLA
jgi:hypothetical protein